VQRQARDANQTDKSFVKSDLTPQTTRKESVTPDFAVALKDGVSAARQKREPTKLECGLLGALLASTVLALMFGLGIELYMLTIIIPLAGNGPPEPLCHCRVSRGSGADNFWRRASVNPQRKMVEVVRHDITLWAGFRSGRSG
jgi:hypothetical protein